MERTIFFIIVGIVVLDFLVERILDALNAVRVNTSLPERFKGFYDEQKYKQSQEYKKVKDQFGLLVSTLSFLALIALLWFEGFAWLDEFWRQYTSNEILLSLLFFGSLGLVADLLSTPFAYYNTFVIEDRFGFNKMDIKTFITDKLKGWLLGVVIGGGLLALIVLFYQAAGDYFWLIAWIVITLFSIFMTMFYSTLIVPLFYKQTPLEDGPLREEIENFAKKAGFKLDNIFVINGSKRSAKSNAYFSGLGPKKRIVLFDTLIENHSKEELVAVLAHEIGHYKKKHTLLNVILSVVQTGILLYVLSLFIDNPLMSGALGADQPSFHMGVLAFSLLFTPINFILGFLMNKLSRKFEYQADEFAGKQYSAEALKTALKKLSADNLSNLHPHPAYVSVYYSHPPVMQRLEYLDQFEKTD
ncbi:MAG: M48 family metallopeptidase [Bacteroidales bacterium]|nr:M48 family metallopeptidase [Bacteroidales bacterium]MCF8327780.1 M48 family metallopeptidase [Bacteroidales bacterium]